VPARSRYTPSGWQLRSEALLGTPRRDACREVPGL